MRLAIISDIHSNLEALTRTFEIIDSEAVDDIVCLGDVVGYGANPAECLELVQARCSTILLGNHDAAAIDLSVAAHFTLNAQLSARWTFAAIPEESKELLRDFTHTKHIGNMLLSHGSPAEPQEWHYVISELDRTIAFRSFTEKICFIGHSHIPVVFSERGKVAALTSSGRHIVNVGSVGQPRDGNPQLSFGIFDTDSWEYRNIRADYDIGTATEKIRKAGLPIALADRLARGF